MLNHADHELVELTRTGRRDAFAELVRRYQDQTYGLCLSLLRSPDEAADAAQEAFIKAFKNLTSFRSEAKFSSWLYRIAYRTAIDRIRDQAKRKSQSLDQSPFLGERPDPSSDPASRAELKDLARHLLAGLPSEQREALVLREERGFSYEEIASIMSCSIDSVKGRLKRARSALLEAVRHLEGSKPV